MDVNDVFEIVVFSANATVNGDISNTEFNRIITLSENHFLNTLLGAPEQYRYDKPTPRINYSLNRTTRQKLTHLISEPEDLVIDILGQVDYPSKYLLVDAMYTTDFSTIRYAAQEKLSSFLRSKIDPVATNPIYIIRDTGFQFYPVNLGAAKISFIRKPSTMFRATVKDTNGRDVYDENNSINPRWSDADMFEIISRALQIVGVNLQLPLLYQYADQIKKEA